MLADVPHHDTLKQLRLAAEFAWQRLCDHRAHGCMTGAELQAWELEHRAFELLFEAAVTRHRAESEMQELLKIEAAYAGNDC